MSKEKNTYQITAITELKVDKDLKNYCTRTRHGVQTAIDNENNSRIKWFSAEQFEKCKKKSAIAKLSPKALFIPYYTGTDGNEKISEVLQFQRGAENGYLSFPAQAHIDYLTSHYDDIQRDLPTVGYSEDYNIFIVMDGANRINAELNLGFQSIECRVIPYITANEMAYYFAHQGDGEIFLKGINKYIALYKAKAPVEVCIHDTLAERGMSIKTRSKGNPPKTFTSCSHIYDIYNVGSKGKVNLDLFLNLWDETEWSQQPDAFKSYFLLVGLAAAKYCNYGDAGYQRLANIMSQLPPEQFLTKAKENYNTKTGQNGYGCLSGYAKAIIKDKNIV